MEHADDTQKRKENRDSGTELFERLRKLTLQYEALQARSGALIDDLKNAGFAHVALLLSQMQLTESLQLCFMAELLTSPPPAQDTQTHKKN